jgi:hypothetical protein
LYRAEPGVSETKPPSPISIASVAIEAAVLSLMTNLMRAVPR